jgi:hypothetical protein
MVSSFEDMAAARQVYFSYLFKAPMGCPINDIFKVVFLFPKLVSDEDNESLKEEILEKQILSTLSAFEKGKILSLDGLLV